MKEWIFSLTLVFLWSSSAFAQEERRRGWGPDHVKGQFAGGIGYLSAGIGYANRKQSLEGDFFYGYVPESKGGVRIHALTLKGTVFPAPPIRWRSVQVQPVSLGLLANYTFGKQYFGFSPDNYPYDYYGHPTAFHGGIFLGGAASIKTRRGSVKRVGLYYELIAFDRQLLSLVNNPDALSLSDIITMGIGLKLQLKD